MATQTQTQSRARDRRLMRVTKAASRSRNVADLDSVKSMTPVQSCYVARILYFCVYIFVIRNWPLHNAALRKFL